MVLQSDEGQLSSAWRALSCEGFVGHGWKVITLFNATNCSVMAGRRCDGNEESLLVGIADLSVPSDAQLPNGQGFTFIQTELHDGISGRSWFALVRQQSGQLAMFSLMATDLVSLLVKAGSDEGSRIYTSLTARIRAWQDFMKRDQVGVLSAEEEIGLIGELVVLEDLIVSGMTTSNAVESWIGPEDGLHDFVIGKGGIEAKTTAATAGFIARIGALDQLDNSLYQPLFVGGVRLAQTQAGRTLPEFIEELGGAIEGTADKLLFSSKLVAAGYINAMRDQYTRRFLKKELSYRLLEARSPVLTRANVPASILEARYSLDLDVLPVVGTSFDEISELLGM